MDLTPERVASMAPGRFFRETVAPVVSLDFHRTEDVLVVAGEPRPSRQQAARCQHCHRS